MLLGRSRLFQGLEIGRTCEGVLAGVEGVDKGIRRTLDGGIVIYLCHLSF